MGTLTDLILFRISYTGVSGSPRAHDVQGALGRAFEDLSVE